VISKANVDLILSLVKKFLPSVLEEVGFDPTVKEPGHTYGERVEEKLVEKLNIYDNEKFTLPKTKRSMQDLNFVKDSINIKFGYDKDGQPNMVSFNRLCNKFLSGEIDSYYIISIDGFDNKICMFNLYQHLDYTNTNLGTGQTMLKEKKFFEYFDQEKNYTITKKDVILKLKDISQKSHRSHIELREQQEQNRQEQFNAKLQLL
tara:strand:+ start:624 stop:1235 length:612 start_codon:yes stop_codon:yes gene_type:complete